MTDFATTIAVEMDKLQRKYTLIGDLRGNLGGKGGTFSGTATIIFFKRVHSPFPKLAAHKHTYI